MSEYNPVASTGKLKLKGVKDSRVDKKKKKKKAAIENDDDPGQLDADKFTDKSVMLKTLEDEDAQMVKEERRKMGVVDGKAVEPGAGTNDGNLSEKLKTEAERRYAEQRRKRLEERLRKEGVKTHKERVEELNRYLSNLSEHHDMPKIGPG